MPWYKKIPCWFGKHDWEYWDEELGDGRVHAWRKCRYCGQAHIIWINYTIEGW